MLLSHVLLNEENRIVLRVDKTKLMTIPVMMVETKGSIPTHGMTIARPNVSSTLLISNRRQRR